MSVRAAEDRGAPFHKGQTDEESADVNVNASIATLSSASGRAEWPLLAIGSVAAVATAFVFGAAEDIGLRAVATATGVAAIMVPFALLRRLELALYAFIPLITAVPIAPAPADFMAVGLLGALVLRGGIRRISPPKIVLVALPLFLVSYAIAALSSPSEHSLMYAATTLVMVAIGCVAYELASRDRRTAERAVLIAGLVVASQAVLAFSPVGEMIGMREDGLRIRGLFTDAKEFGSFTVPAVLLLCVRWPALSVGLRAAGIGILLLPVIASSPRGAGLALGVALVVLAAIAAYRRLRRVFARTAGVLVVGVIGVLMLMAIPGAAFPERGTTSFIQPYDTERFAGQTAGLNHFLAHPISFGIGPGNYEERLGHASHQTYLRMLVETGPVSLVALLLLLWAGITVIRTRDLGAVVWGSALAGLAACGLFVDTLHWRVVWLVLGVTLVVVRDRVGARLETPSRDAEPVTGSTNR